MVEVTDLHGEEVSHRVVHGLVLWERLVHPKPCALLPVGRQGLQGSFNGGVLGKGLELAHRLYGQPLKVLHLHVQVAVRG